MREVMLTTFDNPFDPFTQFNEWFHFDLEKGYNSCDYLARISRTSEEFTEKENVLEIEKAIDEIIMLDPFNIYKKVVKDLDSSKLETSNPNSKPFTKQSKESF